MANSKNNLFNNPDLAVSLLVPNLESEGVAYKYLKTLAREFPLKLGQLSFHTELSGRTVLKMRCKLDASRQ